MFVTVNSESTHFTFRNGATFLLRLSDKSNETNPVSVNICLFSANRDICLCSIILC